MAVARLALPHKNHGPHIHKGARNVDFSFTQVEKLGWTPENRKGICLTDQLPYGY